ncbi:kinase-like protein [Aspergillus avenaceus]|uniref:Kinase-like protein n=1 Tax=Aspergillus avenaceus TaxID=36643 RepID=A0A5N6U0G4_ASPAV|nr:kinase-like protein [Aspergillus avenaceus]
MSATKLALDIVSSVELSPTEHLLLKNFVEAAVYPEVAAQYLISRARRSEDVETSLRGFKNDWKRLAKKLTHTDPCPKHLTDLACRRDGPGCSLRRYEDPEQLFTMEPAFIIPPSMINGVTTKDDPLLEILEAFLSPEYIRHLQQVLAQHKNLKVGSLQNIVLLSPSIHNAFRQGHVDVQPRSQLLQSNFAQTNGHGGEHQSIEYALRKLYPEPPVDLYFADGTMFRNTLHFFKIVGYDTKSLTPPNPLLFEIHRRFSYALHLFSIEDKIAHGWTRSHGYILELPKFIIRILRYLWLFVPFVIRMHCCLLLLWVGRHLYGTGRTAWIQPVPFGLVIKECLHSSRNEANALRLVERYTSISAPRVIDVIECRDITYLIMTRLHGEPLAEVWHLMTYAERDQCGDDLKACVNQLRRIPNHTPYMFGNSLGGPSVDHRLPTGTAGPFNSEADFHAHLGGDLTTTEVRKLPLNHYSYFTHCDFHPTNLLISHGRLSGIVDWDCAGYMPEYWEFTKAMYCARGADVYEQMFYRAFGREYDSELEEERALWSLTAVGR